MKIHTEVQCTTTPLEPSAIDRLNSRLNSKINSVSKKVNTITPYMSSQTAYIDDTEVIFDKAKDGMVTANCITDSGMSVPTTIEIQDNEIIVHFEALDELATVNIIIQ